MSPRSLSRRLSPRLGTVVLAVMLLDGCQALRMSSASVSVAEPLRYRVQVLRSSPDAKVSAIDVRVNLAQQGPREFLFTQPGPVDAVRVWRGAERVETVALDKHDRLQLPADATAFEYTYPLTSLIDRRGGSLLQGAGQGSAHHVAGRAYLMRPRVVPPTLEAELTVIGNTAHLPWAPQADGRYRVPGMALVDSGFHVFGGERCTVRTGRSRIDVVRLDGALRVTPAQACEWIAQSVQEVLTILPRYPYPRTLVSLVPTDSRLPSPFGMFLWSAPPSVALYVGARAEPEAFARDWVATHELLHQLHPSFQGEASWLPEGLATYYTEISRMRSGRFAPNDGWLQLSLGFSRGAEQANGRTFSDALAAMKDGVYLPTYWGGALMALELDLRIREATAGKRSLDDVLASMAGVEATTTLARFGAKVDSVAGRPVFEEVRALHFDGPALARATALLGRLGVEPRGPSVLLHEQAPASAIRNEIQRTRTVAVEVVTE